MGRGKKLNGKGKERAFIYWWLDDFLASNLSSTTKLVLLIIFSHMNKTNQFCFASQERIAILASLSPKAVNKHVKVAKETGWLIVEQHCGKGQKWRNNMYYPSIPDEVLFGPKKADYPEYTPSSYVP